MTNLSNRCSCGGLRHKCDVEEIERLNADLTLSQNRCGALAFLLYGPSTYRPLNPLEEEIERLRRLVRTFIETVESCEFADHRSDDYFLSRDALLKAVKEHSDEPEKQP